jgi:methanogenic corrinoid protein MtbC1
MNSARDYACSVWRSPVPSVEALEGALVSYAEEVTAGLRKEMADGLRELSEKLKQEAMEEEVASGSLFERGFSKGMSYSAKRIESFLSTQP